MCKKKLTSFLSFQLFIFIFLLILKNLSLGTPLAQLPILEVDGKTLFQSNAIIRFLAKKFDLLGSSELEAYDVDAVIETIGDLRQREYNFYTNTIVLS